MLIDFENTQPKDVASLNGGRYKIKVFLGAHQAKIPLEMARALQAFGPHAEYIQTTETVITRSISTSPITSADTQL